MLTPNTALRSQIVPGEADPAPTTTNEDGDFLSPATRARMSWSQLLKRVFEIDIAICLLCGGTLTILAAPSAGSGQASRIPP